MLRASAACAAIAPRSVAERSLRVPPKVPKPVRTPERKTTASSRNWGALRLVLLEEETPTEALYDWERMCRLVAAQRPMWEPGTKSG